MAVQTTTFKGARYLVKFHDPIAWSSTESYEAIEAVQHEASTYISKQPVPAGVEITNTDFWLLWADPNAQMEELRQLVDEYVEDVQTLETTVEQNAVDAIDNCLLCVSTTSNEGSQPYQYAVSFDGGVSWQEIRESLNFASTTLLRSDVQVFPYGNGVFLVPTASNATTNIDTTIFYTEDFETYTRQEIDFGFVRLSKSITGSSLDKDSYVWTPNIVAENDRLFLTASVSTGVYDDTIDDVYFISHPRQINIYAVEISIEDGVISKIGDIFEVNLPANRTSTMDASFCFIDNTMYCAYKDRVYDVINIARANSIETAFTDIVTCVDNMFGVEAPYLLNLNDTLALFNTCYFFDYNQMHYFDYDNNLIHSTQYIGCVNSYSNSRMRNPYPCVLKKKLAQKFFDKYPIDKIPTKYKFDRKQQTTTQGSYAIGSQVLYESNYNVWFNPKEWMYMSASIREGYDDIYIGDMENESIQINIPGNKTVTVHFKSGFNRAIVNNEASAKIYTLFSSGRFVKQAFKPQAFNKTIELAKGLSLYINAFNDVISYAISGTLTETLSNNTTLGTIESAYRPKYEAKMVFYSKTLNYTGVINITPSGNVVYYGDDIGSASLLTNSCIVLGA